MPTPIIEFVKVPDDAYCELDIKIDGIQLLLTPYELDAIWDALTHSFVKTIKNQDITANERISDLLCKLDNIRQIIFDDYMKEGHNDC